MKWSSQQKAIIEAAVAGKNVLVNADAGSGKTTLQLEIARRIERPSLMLSFNTDIKTSNAARAKSMGILLGRAGRGKNSRPVGHLDVRTFHGWGITFFPHKIEVDPYKVDRFCEREFRDRAEAGSVSYVLRQIRGRGFLETDAESLRRELADPQYLRLGERSTDVWMRNAELLGELLERLDSDRKRIDFDDMCRLPVKNRWIERSDSIPDVLYPDEIQDLNPDQRRMIEQALVARPDTQIIATGDAKQSIYGFRGASGSMAHMTEILERVGGVALPLNTTYRCRESIVEFVNSQIETSAMTASGAGGEVYRVRADDPDDPYAVGEIARQRVEMIISSRNSTLISIWIELFLAGTDASLKGSGVISGLKSAIAAISTYNWRDFVNTLRETVRANRRSRDLDSHADAAKGVLEIIKRLRVSNKHELFRVLEQIGLQDRGIKLETVHSAKGREAERVAVICDWWTDREGQRDNLRYVAFTRAIDFLMLVKPSE